MFFGKRKGMIDIGKLHKKGIIESPKEEPKPVETDENGFVDLAKKESSGTGGFFGFLDKPATQSNSFSNETNGYNKREVDQKIFDLDNKIYKLEQRIELLERKAGVGSNNSVDSNPIGW